MISAQTCLSLAVNSTLSLSLSLSLFRSFATKCLLSIAVVANMRLTWRASLHRDRQSEREVAEARQTMEGDWMDDKGQLIADNYLSV